MLTTLALAAILTASPLPAVVGPSEQPSVAVLPLVVQGDLPERWKTNADDRLHVGLGRGALRIDRIPQSDCADWSCAGSRAKAAGADFGVWAQLTVHANGRDYSLQIKAVGADTESVVASLEGKCELCGFEEAIAMVEGKAAAMSTAVERLGGNPIVAFSGTPDGVEVEIDGQSLGRTPVALPLAPGPHKARLSKAGYLPQTFDVAASAGVRKELTFALVSAQLDPVGTESMRPMVDPSESAAPMIVAGAVLTSLGIAGSAAGATLLALHGREFKAECRADAEGDCERLYSTIPAGAIGTAVGSAALGGGIALLVVGLRRRGRARGLEARLRPALSGLSLSF